MRYTDSSFFTAKFPFLTEANKPKFSTYSTKLLLQPPLVHVAILPRLDRRWSRLAHVFLRLRVRVCVGSSVCWVFGEGVYLNPRRKQERGEALAIIPEATLKLANINAIKWASLAKAAPQQRSIAYYTMSVFQATRFPLFQKEGRCANCVWCLQYNRMLYLFRRQMGDVLTGYISVGNVMYVRTDENRGGIGWGQPKRSRYLSAGTSRSQGQPR